MIMDRKWVIASKYGKQGLNQKQIARHQIQPVKALAGGLLSQGIRMIYKDPGSKAALKKLTSWVKSKYKGKLGTLGKLELKKRKAEGLAKYAKLLQTKTTSGAFKGSKKKAKLATGAFRKTELQTTAYAKKINEITKAMIHKPIRTKLHSTGGLSAATPHGYLAGGLLTKGVKTAYKLAKQKYPRLFTSKALSMIRDTKTRNYSQLKQLGFDKGLKPKQLRKMAVSEVLKERLNKLKRLSITHHNKAAKIVKSKMITPWNKTTGKAKAMFTSRQYRNIHRYDRTSTQKKLDALRTSEGDLSVYQESIKAKRATKHALGGEVVIGKNVDGGLL